MAADSATTYFAFGSNMWKQQLQTRCPSSKYVGVARLPNYRWIITEQGGANIVKESSTSDGEVWGLAFELQPNDEEQLDIFEKVPIHFSKERIDADLWEQPGGDSNQVADLKQSPSTMKMLVYVSYERIKVGKPRDEYVIRMNKAIADASKMGVPGAYIENVLRKFIPTIDED